jgi:hypothetical protein
MDIRRIKPSFGKSPGATRGMALAAIALTASAGAGIAVASGATSPPPPDLSTEAAGGVAQSVPAGLQSSFAALRRARQSSDALPQTAGTYQESGGIGRHYGVNASLSRLVGSADGMSVWLVPGSTGSCVVVSTGGGACGSNESLLSKGLTIGLVPTDGGSPIVIGVVPDEANVTAEDASGTQRSVSVLGNAYSLSGSNTASFTVDTTAGGATTESMPAAAPPPTQQSNPGSGEAE